MTLIVVNQYPNEPDQYDVFGVDRRNPPDNEGLRTIIADIQKILGESYKEK